MKISTTIGSARSVLTIAACLFVAGCGKPEKSESGKEPGDPNLTSTGAEAAPDMASAEKFARKFEAALDSDDKNFISKHLDFTSMLDDLLENSNVPPQFIADVKKGAASGRENVITQFMAADYDFLRMLPEKKAPTALFRIRRDGGIDYAEYVFSESAGKPAGWVVSDAYAYSVGTAVSEIQSNMIAPVLAQFDRPTLMRMLGPDRDLDRHVKTVEAVNSMQQHLFSGDTEGAVGVWNALPDPSKYDKLALLIYLRAASMLDDSDAAASLYSNAIDSFMEHFPDDPAINLIGIDRAFLDGDFATVKKLIRDLNDKVDDPYLEFYAGYVFLAEGDHVEAEIRARGWIANAPDDIEGWNLLLESGFASDRHRTTAEALAKLESDFGTDFGTILGNPEWSSFLASDHGKTWVENRRTKVPTDSSPAE